MSSNDEALEASNIPEPTKTLESGEPREMAMPDRIGQFKILGKIGEGGMGTVYEAEQDSPKRTVALKVIRAGLASPGLLKRFELESQVLGRLQHPGIAQVYQAGTADTNKGKRPYFAMEYVRGVDLRQHVIQKNLSTRDRLELLARICDAVHHAHQKGVIHRDLKPGNILVDHSGQPKILDFGVARATDSDMQVTTMQTDVGQLIGTLQYMSPEQVAADPNELDTRSDVYALGVIAYEMLTGQVPYKLKNKMIHEVARIIREDQPTALSSTSRVFRGDIETIVAKAMEKDKDRRYQSAAGLAEDVRRYLHDEPILARPPSAIYQLQKFAKRNKALAGGLAIAMTALVIGMATSTYLYLEAETARQGEAQQRRLAEKREADAVAAELEQASARQEAEEARASEETQRKLAEQRADDLNTVTEFQQSMLGDIDAAKMGRGIIDELREGIRKGLEKKEDITPQEIETYLASFDRLIGAVNATNLALNVVDEYVLTRAVETIHEDFADQPVIRAAMRQSVAQTYKTIGLYERAMPLQEICLRTRRRVLGDDHPDTLTSIQIMGSLLTSMGKYAEAEPYYREALEGNRRVLGDDHPDTLTSIGGMSYLLHLMGKYAEALPYYREALEGRRRVLGDDHPDTLESINNMGGLLRSMGKYAEAEQYFRQTLEGARRILGDDHPDTLTSIGNMGTLLQAMGKNEEALPYCREALEGNRRVLGDDHPSTLISIHTMGFLLQVMGKYAEAEPYYREALESKRRVLGDDHPSTLKSIANMGFLLKSMGKYAEVEPFFREALEVRRRVLGDDHPDTLGSINSMGFLLKSMGKYAEALPYYREALDGRRRVLGDDHPQTLFSISGMGGLLNMLGRFDDAVELMLESEATARRLWIGGNARWLGLYIANFGEALTGQGTYAEAETLLLEAHALLTAGFGDDHERTTKTIKRIISLYESWHASEPGKGYATKAAEWRAKLPKTDETEPAKP